MKEFIKPTRAKIIIFILFFILNYFIIKIIPPPLDGMMLVGFPLGFYYIGSVYDPNHIITQPIKTFLAINFIINVIIWYLISCLIVYIYNKIKKN